MKTATVVLGLYCLLAPSRGARGDDPEIDPKKLPPAAPGKIDFRRDVEPLLRRACVRCHGAKKQRGGLRLDSGDLAMQGSDSGPVIVPGKAAASRLLHVVAGLDPDLRMPPKGEPPLTVAELGTLRVCLGRAPTAREREALSGLHRDLTALARSGGKEVTRLLGSDAVGAPDRAAAAAWVALARALMNLDEFVTRE